MGKHKKENVEQNRERNQSENSENNKLINNLNNSASKKEKSNEKKFKNKFNLDFNKIEEKFNNKFDIHYSNLNYMNNIYNHRKESKDSTNDSFSCEDFYEEHNYLNQNNNYNSNKIQLNSQKKSNRREGQFKSTAADFKIKYKTELCKFYEINGICKYGDKCAYAHGKENLRSKVTNSSAYRTRKCTQFFESGYCPYGSRCQFAHQLSTNIINNPYDKKMTYSKIMEMISKFENIENIKTLILKPRLAIFKEILKDEFIGGSTLFNDIKNIKKNDIIERID